MLAEAREELARADGKASILFAALGVAAGVIAAAIVSGDWNPRDLQRPWEAIWWAGGMTGTAAATLLALAVYPKIVNRHPGAAVTYFNEIAQLASIDSLDGALKRMSEDERVLKQLYAVSKIARKKYLFIVWSMRLLALGLGLMLLASIASS
jgi:hypothetical protein